MHLAGHALSRASVANTLPVVLTQLFNLFTGAPRPWPQCCLSSTSLQITLGNHSPGQPRGPRGGGLSTEPEPASGVLSEAPLQRGWWVGRSHAHCGDCPSRLSTNSYLCFSLGRVLIKGKGNVPEGFRQKDRNKTGIYWEKTSMANIFLTN